MASREEWVTHEGWVTAWAERASATSTSRQRLWRMAIEEAFIEVATGAPDDMTVAQIRTTVEGMVACAVSPTTMLDRIPAMLHSWWSAGPAEPPDSAT